MATTVLGKTRFDIKGTWSSGTATYRTDDIVFYNGGWYIATAATIAAGTLPTNASFWAPYRVSFNYRGTHVNTTGTVYKAYDTVLYTVQNTIPHSHNSREQTYRLMFVLQITQQTEPTLICH